MTGVSIEIKEVGLEAALNLVQGFADAPTLELTEGIGRLMEERTRKRIEEDKKSPDGKSWKPNVAGTSILYREGNLARSIDYVATSDSVQIGSALVYARIHQMGGTIKPKTAKALAFMIGGEFRLVQSVTIPARPYLGISGEDEREIISTTEDWMRRLVQ